MILLERTIEGRKIICRVELLDKDIHVLLTGGDQSHIGAFTLAVPGEVPATSILPGHKEGYISERWAKHLSAATGQSVMVVCGIHYDQATKELIERILTVCEDMLQELIRSFTM